MIARDTDDPSTGRATPFGPVPVVVYEVGNGHCRSPTMGTRLMTDVIHDLPLIHVYILDACLGVFDRAQGESHSEIPSQTSHTPPSPEELREAPAPAPAPVQPAFQPDTPGQEIRDVIQLLTRLVAAQSWCQEVGIGHADRSISARVRDFINLDPPIFSGADPNEEPQDVVVNWYSSWELSKGEDASLAPGMDISRIQAYAQGAKERPSQNSRASSSQYRGESSQMRLPLPRCSQCGKQHVGQCRMGLGVCYTCGYPCHVMRYYPMRGGTSIVQPAGSVVGSSSSIRPPRQGSQAPISRGRGRGGVYSSIDPQNRIYALGGRHNQESSPNVVTGILSVSSYDVYALVDLGSTLSYVTLLVASKFGIEPELIKPFEVSTPVGDPVIARRVYKDCTVVVHSRSTVADLIELDMVEFYVILGIDCLASYYANVDCRSKMDVKVELLTIQSIPVVNEFPDVFPDELPGLPPEREIEFVIDLLPDTQPISTPPYRMVKVSKVDTQNIEIVKIWPSPTTPTEVRSFLGLAGKANVVADALSRRSMSSLSYLHLEKSRIAHDIHLLSSLGVRLLDSVKERQYKDPVLADYRDTTPQKEKTPFEITGDGVLRYRGRLCVPDVAGLRRQVMGETHYSRYSVHPGATKIYHDIRELYWWDRIKKDIAEFVAQCPNCQQVKIEHQKLLQAMEIPTWKTTYSVEDYARLYIKEIVRLHGVPISIISDRGSQFTANFWRSFQKGLGTQVTEQLSYEETPIAILDRQVQRLRTNDVASVRVLWRNNNVEEMTWEAEEEMNSRYPHLFSLPEKDPTETSQP
ncbi:uncharacterized protein [Nicotiana tomentosiformis]|uniref:uncharacterized protein n=1 Tax=Nicotiana tomentosiformis TaxID=4098 RepID=UPI00388C9A81